jgi:hypothetical protein
MDKFTQDVFGSQPLPALRPRETITAAIRIADRLSKTRPLDEVTFWCSKTDAQDRGQTFLVRALLILRRRAGAGILSKGEEAWEIVEEKLAWGYAQ